MEVEKVGKKPRKSAKKLTTKTKWIILFSVLGAAIVGLVIAIIVVLVVRGNNAPEVTEEITEYDEALGEYFDDNDDVATAIVDQQLDGEGILKLIKEKIDVAENEMAKAMLEEDYYMTMFAVYGADESKKDEIINGLIEVEKILGDSKSAESVAAAALGYRDFDIYKKYVEIVKERNPDYQSIYDMLGGEPE